jgi:hypothetical protein
MTTHQPDSSIGNRCLAVEYRPVGDLIPYTRNARSHDDAHVAQIPIGRDG